MSIRVGLCVHRTVEPEFLQSALGLWPMLGDKAVFHTEKGADVAEARNRIGRVFEEDYLLLVDGDMQFRPKDALSILGTLEKNPKLGAVSAFYIKWDGSQLPVCNWRDEDGWYSDERRLRRGKKHAQHKEIAYVDSLGGGLLAVSREAMDSLGHPWFYGEYVNGVYHGNDTTFCLRLQKQGFKPAVDFGVPVVHVGPTPWDARIHTEGED